MSKRLPKWIKNVVCEICAGYTSRLNAILWGEVKGGVKAEYERINNIIDDSLREVFDNLGVQNIFRRDIATRTGWQFSVANEYFGRNTYKRRKAKAIYTIAKSLHLIA